MDYAATLFAHNHLYNGMLQTKDAGLLTGYFSSGGTLNGQTSQVAYNVLHDSYDIFGMRIGTLGLIYLDEGTCDVDLHHNLLWAAPGSLSAGCGSTPAAWTCTRSRQRLPPRVHPHQRRSAGPTTFPRAAPSASATTSSIRRRGWRIGRRWRSGKSTSAAILCSRA